VDQSRQVVVVGGGISGLSCAYRLRQLGIPVELFEAASATGGLMNTALRDGFLFESGPQSFQGTPLLLQLIRELKLEGDLCKGDNKSPRYVLRHGRMQKIAMSPQALLASSFLSAGSRWKIASEPFRRTTPPTEDESIAAFVRRKFGHEILEYLVSPFVSGVYAGDPEKLSLRAAFPSLEEWEREYGSVIRGAAKSRKDSASEGPPPLCSFRRGVVALTWALATALGPDVTPKSPVAAVLPSQTEGGGFTIRFENGMHRSAAAVILAAPAYTASHIVQTLDVGLAQTLSGIPYTSVAVYAAGYRNKQASMPPNGFGLLIPRSENHRTLGIVFNSSLFPGRAPEGHFTITSFLGGAMDTALLDQSQGQIEAIAIKDSSTILGITGEPVNSALWRHPKALPQYNLGHGHIVAALREGERANPGLFFSGNYLEGPSIGKCVERAFKTAEAVRECGL
jgi:oxygen-dependent protoporphyrinogen oxidase